MLTTIDDINFNKKRALIRVDFNVPMNEEGQITDDNRIKAVLPTLQKILDDGGSCIIISHMGRPKGRFHEKYSLRPVIKQLATLLQVQVNFSENCIGEESTQKVLALQPREVLLLENLRFHSAEEQGNVEFAKALAAYGDIYVNDAFGTAHRAHASTKITPTFFEKKCLGLSMAQELSHADHVMRHAKRPFTAIMGGAKVSDKILIIDRLIDKIDHLILGGGMAYTFWAAQGGKIGSSLIETKQITLVKQLMDKMKHKGITLHLPIDSVIAPQLDGKVKTRNVASNNIPQNWMGLDIGSKAREDFAKVVLASKTILWNGPMGVFEIENFAAGTQALAQSIVKATTAGAFSLIGGGDSVAAAKKFAAPNEFSYLSTGGGALLAYFEGRPLPALVALQ